MQSISIVLLCHRGAVYISILNLVAIAVDRHLIVCKPLLHSAYRGRLLTFVFVGMYPLMAVVCSPPLFLLYVENGVCTSNGETVFGSVTAKRVYSWLGVATLCFYYLLPLMAFLYLYSTLVRGINYVNIFS